MTMHEEPAVVDLEELLHEQESHAPARTAGQITLIVVLSIIGLVAVSVLAILLLPVVAEAVLWWVHLVRSAQGA